MSKIGGKIVAFLKCFAKYLESGGALPLSDRLKRKHPELFGKTDAEFLANDWRTVGNHIRNAMNVVGNEIEGKGGSDGKSDKQCD